MAMTKSGEEPWEYPLKLQDKNWQAKVRLKPTECGAPWRLIESSSIESNRG